MRTPSTFVFSLLIGGGILAPLAQILYYYPRLPERVASHFGPSGAADGWMSKDAFIGSYVGLMAFLLIVFVGVGYGIGAIPKEAVNLPNKDYWFSSERRTETLIALRDQMLTLGAATALLMTAVMQLVFQANVTGTMHLGNVAPLLLLAYLAFTTVWTIGLLKRFQLPKA